MHINEFLRIFENGVGYLVCDHLWDFCWDR